MDLFGGLPEPVKGGRGGARGGRVPQAKGRGRGGNSTDGAEAAISMDAVEVEAATWTGGGAASPLQRKQPRWCPPR